MLKDRPELRFRSPQAIAADSDANFGIEGASGNLLISSAALNLKFPSRTCRDTDRNFKFAAVEGSDQSSGQQRMSVSVVQNKDERSAFNEVFLPYLPEAYRLAQWLTGSASDAEDIVQEAALRAFRGIKGFGAVNARAWSLAIVRNTALSWLTKNRPRTVVYMNDLSAVEQQELEYEGLHGTRIETPEEIALFKADAKDVQDALEKLPTQFREVIVLREINQMNYRDIAEVVNVPIGTVMSRLSRGRQLMIALLGDRRSS
jgi:RNA polymerase sigma factor (sigma-70 family)